MIENWRPVVGYESRYEVSDLGRVRSLMSGQRLGEYPRKAPLILQPAISGGYHKINLCSLGMKPRNRWVHQLVLEAFVGPRPEKMEAGHLNGVGSDNRLANLKWITSAENKAHMAIHGTRRMPTVRLTGEQNGSAKLTRAAAEGALARLAAGETQASIAALLGVTAGTIGFLARGETWKDLPRPAKEPAA